VISDKIVWRVLVAYLGVDSVPLLSSKPIVLAELSRAALRHITQESGHEAESARAQVEDAVNELLSPLLAQAIESG